MLAHLRAPVAGLLAALVLLAATSTVPRAQTPPLATTLLAEWTWRNVGPFRGGPTTAAVGVPTQPNVFYLGAANGGVWKTTDYGRTWRPVFDGQPTTSIGAIAVSDSNPNVVYVGTGSEYRGPEGWRGSGIYRSDDAGRTWRHLGLIDSDQIPDIVIDPRDPDRVFVAALGHAYGPNAERGVFRTTDGGRSFDRVLPNDADTGAMDVAFDPDDATVVYAVLRQARWSASSDRPAEGPGTGVFKSADGGRSWRRIGRGLPSSADGLGAIALATTAHTRRLLAVASARTHAGLYASDDGGESWSVVNADPRVFESTSRPAVAIDPGNANVVYVLAAAVWKSVDGGKTLVPWYDRQGVAGYHALWINAAHPDLAILAGARGAVVTTNGGDTWSARGNQPTADVTSVVVDSAFPYRICGAERGAEPVCGASRTSTGWITPNEWETIAIDDDGPLAPDPSDPDVLYAGAVRRFDRRTGQTQDVSPEAGGVAPAGSRAPVMFAPTDPRTLYFATDVLWKTVTGGQTWAAIAPRDNDAVRERARISTVAPSHVDGRVIWIGTEQGRIRVTRDSGTTWIPITLPVPETPPSVAHIEASHFDPSTAYVALDGRRADDGRVHLWRTRDAGATWTDITAGLPREVVVNAVREDPLRRGLLFAGTSNGVLLSDDDGDTWQPFALNLPAVPVTDLTIKDGDLLVATAGRGFWVLNDFSPLRQLTGDVRRADLFLFRPLVTWRLRSGRTTAVQPDEAAVPNPPAGATLHYLVGPGAPDSVTIELVETLTGEVIRRFSSDGTGTPLSSAPGLHRIAWDLRYTPIDGHSMLVSPGTYQVRLTSRGRTIRQAVTVRMDPRSRVAATDLDAQARLSKAVYEKLRDVRAGVAGNGDRPPDDRGSALDEVTAALGGILDTLQQSDARPTPAISAAAAAAIARANAVLSSADAIALPAARPRALAFASTR